jgi:hypothetical protein
MEVAMFLKFLPAFFLLAVFSRSASAEFPLVKQGRAAAICIDADAHPAVKTAARLLSEDIERVSGVLPEIVHALRPGPIVLIGQIGKSKILHSVVDVPADEIRGQWERWLHRTIGETTLVIAGSDFRGTAYGALEISRMIGVSPWYFWADVEPQKQAELILDVPDQIFPGPAVQYRGIFINDEDVNFRPWTLNYFAETDVGPKSYAAVFELMLRLRANYLWPAMHNYYGRSFTWDPPPYETMPFYYVEGNREMADTFGIVMGSSHHEPLHRNNLYEWDAEHEEPYGYTENRERFLNWLKKRVREVRDSENIFTLAMRGKGDVSLEKSLPPGTDMIEVVQNGLDDQRQILEEVYGRPASEIPQIFVAYSEGLKQLKSGLEIPEDVTLIWPDNNYGKLRGLPNETMQQRSGGHGLYYHFEHLGGKIPNRYTWLDSVPLDLVVQEHLTALDNKVDKLWIVNVGDIKPHEKEIDFYMELAWNPKPWTAKNAEQFYEIWAARTFGREVAPEIAAIQAAYIDLTRDCRPEYTGYPGYTFSREQQIKRTRAWMELISRTDRLAQNIPARLQDAFFQLIAYPVKAAGHYQCSRYFGQRSIELAEAQSVEANSYARRANSCYFEALTLTRHYTSEIKNGKWKHMMVFSNFTPFRPPPVGWVYPRNPHLPELKLTDARLRAPMTISDNILIGTAKKRCAPEDGGAATWTFTSHVGGYVELWLNINSQRADADSLYITFNGNQVCAEWLLNESPTLKAEQKRKAGFHWQRVMLLDLKPGTNTLSLHQCEATPVSGIRLQAIQ